ncbi:MAG: MFS transporter [Eubacterium sp.]|nr:MFS transporter [Eubacterium sp.]
MSKNSNKSFNLVRQIRTLYITGVLGNLSLTGAWVVILAARGFSLVEIGFAETLFHITSLICEIPSGMLADIYGRKKMLALGNVMAIVGDLVMVFSTDFWLVALSMPFHAMAYNFASGSGEALAYDSMKLENAEAGYEKYNSNQSIIYRIATGVSTLMAGLALYLGYRTSYLISALMGSLTLFFTLKLVEVRCSDEASEEENKEENKEKIVSIQKLLSELIKFFKESILFLVRNSKAAKLMFLNSFVGAIDILLLFFLQSKLRDAGISNWVLGPALFIMELGGVAGAKLIVKAKNVKYYKIFIICTMGVLAGVLLEHTSVVWIMVLGGFISSMADDAIEIRTSTKLQDMFPSEQRATLISISSFTFSVIMMILSPLAGYFFSIW